MRHPNSIASTWNRFCLSTGIVVQPSLALLTILSSIHTKPRSVPASLSDFTVQLSEASYEKAVDLQQWKLTERFHVRIPSIELSTPVFEPHDEYWRKREWELLEEQMQVGLLYGAVAYPTDSLIIAGHSSPPNALAARSAFGHIFENLPNVQIGDSVSISEAGVETQYRIVETDIVSPAEIDLLTSARPNELILMTCFPIGSTKDRFVVRALKME